jgi:hypothetical protein
LPGNGSTAITAICHSFANRDTNSENNGRSPKISGAITNPILGFATDVSISAGVPEGKVMRITQY